VCFFAAIHPRPHVAALISAELVGWSAYSTALSSIHTNRSSSVTRDTRMPH
jgi:hypothetical protein